MSEPSPSKAKAIETPEGDYANKLCKCCKCGIERLATFSFDYYTLEKDGKVLLQCEFCFMKEHFGTKTPPMVIVDEDGKTEIREGMEPHELN